MAAAHFGQRGIAFLRTASTSAGDARSGPSSLRNGSLTCRLTRMPKGSGSSLWGLRKVVRGLNDGHGVSSYRVSALKESAVSVR